MTIKGKPPTGKFLLELLIKLIAEQEGVSIKYEIVESEDA